MPTAMIVNRNAHLKQDILILFHRFRFDGLIQFHHRFEMSVVNLILSRSISFHRNCSRLNNSLRVRGSRGRLACHVMGGITKKMLVNKLDSNEDNAVRMIVVLT